MFEQTDSPVEQESAAPVNDAPETENAPERKPRYEDPTPPKPEGVLEDVEPSDPDEDLVALVDDEDGQADTDESDPELVDVEWEGKIYKLTPEVKDALMRQADYTKKTMEVAEQRKAFESQQQQFQQTVQQQEQFFEDAANVRAIEGQLKQFDQVDWNQLSYDDPVEFQRLDFQRRQLVENRNNHVQRMTHAQQEAAQTQQQEVAKLKEQGLKQLAKDIPGWGEETAKTIFKAGMDHYGFNKQEMGSVLDPRMVRVLDDARRYREIVAKSKSKKAPPPVEAEPVKPIKGKSAKASTDPDNMSTKEWMAWREKQVKAKNRR